MDQATPNQALRIINKFGSITQLQRALGHKNNSTVQGWKDRGVIPPRQHRPIWEAAVRLGIELDKSEFAAF